MPHQLALFVLSGLFFLSANAVVEPLTDDTAFYNCPFPDIACDCEPYLGGHDMWCPQRRQHHFQVHYKPGQVWILCNTLESVTEADMLYELRDFAIGPLRSLTLEHCPVYSDTYSRLLDTMNITYVGEFTLRYDDYVGGHFVSGMFEGMPGVTALRIESLYAHSIQEDTFSGLGDVTKLKVSGNGITEVPPRLLYPMPNLEDLDFTETDVTSYPPDFFSQQKDLTRLTIGGRGISKYPVTLFGNQESVIELSFEGLNVQSSEGLPKGLFDPLVNLENITVSGEGIEHLEAGSFDKLTKLVQFNWNSRPCLDKATGGCEMKLENNLFQGKQDLEVWILAHATYTNLTISARFFKDCRSLRHVRFNNCGLMNLPGDTFGDSPKITELDLGGNQLAHIPDEAFKGLTSLERLFLYDNQLESISAELFRDLTDLEVLELNLNRISSIAKPAFRSLGKLERLNLDKNRLATVSDKVLDWSSMTKLEFLSLGDNLVDSEELSTHWTLNMVGLRHLNLTGNRYGPVINALDINFQQSTKVNLSRNNIQRIDLSTALKLHTGSGRSSQGGRRKAQIDLEDNPFICDCHALNFSKFLNGEFSDLDVGSWFSFSTGGLVCDRPSEFNSSLVTDLSYSDFYCVFPTPHETSLKCPSRCECHYVPFKSSVLVQCASQQMQSFPSFVPYIEQAPSVTVDMSDNHLTGLAGAKTAMSNWSSVSELVLSNNAISRIEPSDLPAKLRRLSIDSNMFEVIEDPMLQALGALDGIMLGNNPFSCSCSSKTLQSFVREFEDMILDADNVTINCSGEIKNILQWAPAELCPQVLQTYVFPIVAIVVIFVLVVLIICLYKKRTIMIWIYSHKTLRRLFTEDLVDADKPYDAFISYSNEDKDYVEGKLVPGLESPPEGEDQLKFKCLVHVRDFDLGLNIVQQISDAVDNSRRTVIVLSKNFCQSQWYEQEFSIAHARKRVVVVVHGELPTKEEMGPVMHDYVKTNTYLQDTDPWFWQKLRYALPHKAAGKSKWLPHKKRRTTDQLQLIEQKGGSAANSPKEAKEANGHAGKANGELNNGYLNSTTSIYVEQSPPNSANGGPHASPIKVPVA